MASTQTVRWSIIGIFAVAFTLMTLAIANNDSEPLKADIITPLRVLPPIVKLIPMGIFLPGETKEADLEFSNQDTTHDMKIIGASSSCGCTHLAVRIETVAPNARGDVSAALSSGGQPGGFGSEVVIDTVTDGASREFRFRLKGETRKVITFPGHGSQLRPSPSALSNDGSMEFSFRRAGYPLSFDSVTVEPDDDLIKASVESREPDLWTLKLTPADPTLVGKLNGGLTFRFYQSGQALPVTHRERFVMEVKGVVRASPAALLVGTLRPGQAYETTIDVTADDLAAAQVTAASDTLGLASVTPSADGRSVAFSVVGPAKPGALRGTIRLTVARPDGAPPQTLLVPYLAQVGEAADAATP